MSGLFFTADSLPKEARDILLYNPILHCVELIRSGFFSGYDARHVDAGYVTAWILGLFFFGLTLERKVRHKVQLS